MKCDRYITGFGKLAIYTLVAIDVLARYALRPRDFGWSPIAYLRFLRRACRLLLTFWHNKVVRVANGYKLHLYLPAYPSPAFFYAIESKLVRRPPGPITVVFSMTKACAYKCPHCYQNRDGGPDLDEALLLQTARKVQDAGVAMFDIEGGEPFLRFPRLLRLVQSLDARSEIWVNTTGDRMEPEMLAQLKASGLFGLFVSIHSPDPAKHEAFTGVPGSFQRACDAVRQARALDLAVAFNTCLSEEEVVNGDIGKVMELARQLDADHIQLIHPKPAGTWLGRRDGMQRDERIIKGIRREHACYNSRATADYPSLQAQVFEESERFHGCTAGAVDRFYVNANGEVQPCEFLNLSFGNVNEEPFEQILGRMRSFFPVPCLDWLCCTQADAIYELFQKRQLKRTPLPWSVTQQLVERWNRGKPTPLYASLGIYS